MKNLVFTLLLFIPYIFNAQSESSTDRFIRIVGLSEKLIDHSGMKVEFTLTEIAGNEYKQIRPKSIDDVKNDFIEALRVAGVDPTRLIEDRMKNITKSNYGKLAVEYYSLTVKDEGEAKKVSSLAIDGFKISKVEYIFSETYEQFIDEMSILAIKDARRKAENIAKSVGKTVGEILNIEDMKNVENRSRSSRYGNATSTRTLSYRVNVTFELK